MAYGLKASKAGDQMDSKQSDNDSEGYSDQRQHFTFFTRT